MNEDRDPPSQDRWDEAERILTTPPPDGWEALAQPLSEKHREALIERAMRRRADAAGSRSRNTWRWAGVAGGLAAAAVLLVMMRTDPIDSRFELEMGAGRSELRGGDETTREGVVFSLRNEPGWMVRLTAEDPSQVLSLYLVAQSADGSLGALDAPMERRGPMFRVMGEVGAMGLRPGPVTLYFVVGPRDAKDDAVAEVRTLTAGGAVRPAWHVASKSLQIVE